MFLENLQFSLNATVPVFLMMVFGWFVKKIGLLDDHTTSTLNKFVFRTLLPALLFMDLSTADFRSVWDGRFVLFCMVITLISVGIACLYSLIHQDKHERGEIIQASYRSSAAILGIAFVKNIYGEATMAALMIVGTVLGVFSGRCTGESLPLRVDFIHRVEFEEVSGPRVLIKRGPGNRGPSECGTTHEATSGMSS